MKERIFYLLFLDEELEAEFIEILVAYQSTEQLVDVGYSEGTGIYKVISVPGYEEVWNLLCHKYLASSKDKVKRNGKEYQRVMFSKDLSSFSALVSNA